MVARKLIQYSNEYDKNHQKIGEWAVDLGDSNFSCIICGEGTIVSFKKGLEPLQNHSESKKHRNRLKKYNPHKRQLNLQESLSKDEANNVLLKNTKMLEIDLERRLRTVIQCLVECLKRHLGGENGSTIVDGMSLSYGKADYIAKYGIGKTYFDETVQLLKSCDGFSIGFDESEINKNHEFEVMVILSDKTVGIQLRHYKSISLDGTDADTIVKSLLGDRWMMTRYHGGN